MTDQLPADIAEAIEAFDAAVDNCSHATATVGPREAFATSVEQARAALDAVILKHLRATDQTNTGE